MSREVCRSWDGAGDYGGELGMQAKEGMLGSKGMFRLQWGVKLFWRC